MLNSKEEPESGSFSLEQRVSGDELLDAQDLIEEIKLVGANVDKNGYVTLYHQTTNENADVKIELDSGKELDISNYIVNENGNNSFSFDKKAKRYDDHN